MKQIICKNGEIALCDDEDYPLLSRFTWYIGSDIESGGYPCCFIYGKRNTRKQIFMHQLVMSGFMADHIDQDKMNAQKYNLRPANHQQNGWNRKKQKSFKGQPCSSKYKGVSKYINVAGCVWWNVSIKTTAKGVKPAKYVRKNRFKTEEEAAIWYDEQIVRLRPKWGTTNILKFNNSNLT